MEHLPPELREASAKQTSADPDLDLNDPEVILNALREASGNKTRAAELLGISRRSIYRKIKELNISID